MIKEKLCKKVKINQKYSQDFHQFKKTDNMINRRKLNKPMEKDFYHRKNYILKIKRVYLILTRNRMKKIQDYQIKQFLLIRKTINLHLKRDFSLMMTFLIQTQMVAFVLQIRFLIF